MYRPIDHPDQLQEPIKHQCKFCHNPDAAHKVDYPMHKLSIAQNDKAHTIYTYAAFCDDCGGLSVVAVQGDWPELDADFQDGISYG